MIGQAHKEETHSSYFIGRRRPTLGFGAVLAVVVLDGGGPGQRCQGQSLSMEPVRRRKRCQLGPSRQRPRVLIQVSINVEGKSPGVDEFDAGFHGGLRPVVGDGSGYRAQPEATCPFQSDGSS